MPKIANVANCLDLEHARNHRRIAVLGRALRLRGHLTFRQRDVIADVKIPSHRGLELHHVERYPRGLADQVVECDSFRRGRAGPVIEIKRAPSIRDLHAGVLRVRVDVPRYLTYIRGELGHVVIEPRLILAQHERLAGVVHTLHFGRRDGERGFHRRAERHALAPVQYDVLWRRFGAADTVHNDEIERHVDALPVAKALIDDPLDHEALLLRIRQRQALCHADRHANQFVVVIRRPDDLFQVDAPDTQRVVS